MLIINTSNNPDREVALHTAEALESSLLQKKNVLWTLAGGSAINYYGIMPEMLHFERDFSRLTIALGDERYSKDPYHKDASWPLYKELDLFKTLVSKGATFYNLLSGSTVEGEATRFDSFLKEQIKYNSDIIVNLGIGMDGHTAGIIPMENEKDFDNIYKSERDAVSHDKGGSHPLRITITPSFIGKASRLLVYAVGEEKKSILSRLREYSERKREVNISTFPAIVLANNSAEIFTDQEIT